MSDTRTYYLTRYALTEGIKVVEGEPSDLDADYINIGGYFGSFKLGGEIFETLPEAVAGAERKRVKKIASLKKQIAKLEKMTFEAKS